MIVNQKNISRKSFIKFLNILCLILNLNFILILDSTFCMQQSSTNPNPNRYIQTSEPSQIGPGMASSQACKKNKKSVSGYFNLDFTSAHTHILTIGSLLLCFFLSLNVMNNSQNNTANSNLIKGISSGTIEIQQSQDNIRYNQKKFKCLIETKNDFATCNITTGSNLRIMSEANVSSIYNIYNIIDSMNEYSAQSFDFPLASIVLNILICSSIILFSVIAIKKMWFHRHPDVSSDVSSIN